LTGDGLAIRPAERGDLDAVLALWALARSEHTATADRPELDDGGPRTGLHHSRVDGQLHFEHTYGSVIARA
jgi:hypothetical protein